MLFCRKCGTEVKQGDRFCTGCLSRLDENSVISRQEYSFMLSDKSTFDPDGFVADSDLSGREIMDHRLLQKTGSFAGVGYYRAKRTDDSDNSTVVIRHIMFPDDLSRDHSLIMRRLDRTADNLAARRFTEALGTEQASFQSACAAAGCGCLNYRLKSCYSELYSKYHIFIMMKEALPLPYYAMTQELTLRDALGIMLAVCGQLLKLKRNNVRYGTFSDDMIFIGNDGSVYLDFCQASHFGKYYPFSPVYQHYMQFAAPAGTEPEAYSVGMILFYLISGFRNPFVNPQKTDADGYDFIAAERKRLAMEKTWIPPLAQNMLGSAITSLLSRSARPITLEELERVISNAFNYLSADELNSRISAQ